MTERVGERKKKLGREGGREGKRKKERDANLNALVFQKIVYYVNKINAISW